MAPGYVGLLCLVLRMPSEPVLFKRLRVLELMAVSLTLFASLIVRAAAPARSLGGPSLAIFVRSGKVFSSSLYLVLWARADALFLPAAALTTIS